MTLWAENQKVVCISETYGVGYPKEGTIYTIKGIRPSSCVPSLVAFNLLEMNNSKFYCECCFKRVFENDIGVFQEILKTLPKTEGAPKEPVKVKKTVRIK